MKVPLSFQIIESDSEKAALLNAISYLFDREKVDTNLIKSIYKYAVNENNILIAQETICDFAKRILENDKYNLNLYEYKKEEVNIKTMKEYMRNNNIVIIIRVYLNNKGHYCICTEIDKNYVYLFDSYYYDETYYDNERMVELVFDKPFNYNRKVNIKRFNSMNMNDYSLGPTEYRECLIIQKI